MRKSAGIGLLLCAMGAAWGPSGWAQTGKYPDRAIRLISPFPPGGTVDVTARILAPAVSKSLGQQVVVDNRAGASGIIGTANDHFRKAMSVPDSLRRFEADGLDVVGSTPEQAAATLESELKKWATVVKERGMKAG